MNYVSSNRRLSVIAVALFFMIMLFSQSTATAQIAYIDNNVDSDSDRDSLLNKGSSTSTSYLDAQALDASNETISEMDVGRGTSSISENWTNYKYININHDQVTGDLTDFPVLISILDKDIKRNAQPDGDDITFFDISGTKLSFEIESYNPNYNATHAQLVAWVKSNVSSSVDTRLTMKYGNSTMNSQANPIGVWNSDYASVWHLSENPPTSISDSTSNSNNGIGSGSISSSSGKISNSVVFTDTSGQEISVVNSASLTISDTLTISAWIKPTVITGDWFTIISKSDGAVDSQTTSNQDLYLVIDATGEFFISLTGSSGVVEWNTPYSAIAGVWQYISFTYDSATSIGSLYYNGELLGTNNFSLGTLNTNTNPFYIGYNQVWIDEIFTGIIDEVKFNNIVKSSELIATEYNNQNNPDFFHSVSNEFYFNDPWEYYKQITIDNTKVSEDVNGFPFYLTIIDSDLKTKAQSDGDDIAFFDASGNQLAHELILYDPNYSGTEAQLNAWVKADLSSTVNTNITMKYGDSTLGSQENPAAVWSSSYNNVWHLEEDPSTSAPQIIDSTVNNPGTSIGSMTTGDQVIAQLDRGIDFDGINDEINVGKIDSDAWTALTISVWIYKTDIGDDRIFSVANSTAIGNSIYALLAKDDYFNVRISTDGVGGSASTSITTTAGTLLLNTWQLFTVTWDSVTEQITIYIDGSQNGTAFKDGDSLLDSPEVGLIGNAALGFDRFYTGIIDEVRLSNTAKSANWIATEYNNQNSPSTFYSMGSEYNLDESDPATSLIRTFQDPVDNTVSNLDSVNDIGIHSNFVSEQDKDSVYDTITENLNDYALRGRTLGNIHVGGGSADWRSPQGTISFWLSINSFGGRPWGSGGNFEIDNFGNTFELDWGADNSLQGTTSLSSNQWYFIAVTWNEYTNSLKFYVGDEYNAPSVDASTSSWTSTLIGVSITDNEFLSSPAGLRMDGYGDELRYYDYDRSIYDIQSDYNRVLRGNEPNLKSYFRFNNNLIDSGPNNDDATSEGLIGYVTTPYLTFTDMTSLATTGTEYFIIGDGSTSWGSENGTISFWFKLNTLGDKIWGQSTDFRIEQKNGDELEFEWGQNNSIRTISTFGTGVWYFLAITWNEQTDTINLYVGDENNAPTLDNSRTDWTVQVSSKIATLNTFMADVGSTPVDGFGDELRYFSIDRSLLDIQSDYNITLSGDENGLQSYFKFNGDYRDYGPKRDDGSTFGTTSFSSSPIEMTNQLDLELQFLSVPVQPAVKLGIYTGTLGSEDILVDYWNGINWVNLITDLNQSTWNNITISSLVTTNTFTIRFRDGTGNSDLIQDSWQIDAVIITYTNYQLEWEHQVQSIDLTKENISLTIYGTSSDSNESFEIQMWDLSATDWTTPFVMKIGTSEQWYNYTLNDPNVIGSTITWRYRGTNETKDNIQSTLIINYAGIAGFDEIPVFDIFPADLQYDEGAGGNSLVWDLTDDNPNKYTIFRDEINLTSSSWSNPQPITHNVDGLLKGSYNYKIMVTDVNGNHANDSVLVTVVDGTNPTISLFPADYQYAEGTGGNELNWSASDNYFDFYEIYNDTGLIQTESWSTGINITLNIDGLLKGVYNYTLTVFDTTGNSANDTVQVIVIDTTFPDVDHPLDIEYSEGTSNNKINWIATDAYNATYEIWNTTDMITSGFWNSGEAVIYNIDGLLKGNYNFTIIVFDSSGNSVFDTVFIAVIDTTDPGIDNPSDNGYSEESVGHSIDWFATDAYPAYYEIYINDQLNETFPSWVSGVTITVNIDGLLKGDNNITIVVYDVSGNLISDSVIVTVIDTTIPEFNNPLPINFQYNESSIGNEIEWLISDNYPNTFSIYLDDEFLFSSSWTSGNMIINVDGLGLGVHNYTIVIFDKSSLQSSDTVLVTVIDGTAPIISSPPVDVTYAKNSIGNTIGWVPTDLHPNNYIISNDTHQVDSGTWFSGATITLNIDGLDIGLVNFTITLFDDTGNQFNDTVTVEITAESVFISKPDNTFYINGTVGNFLNWTVSDANPHMYFIYKNGSEVDSGTWLSGEVISWNIDGLAIDWYNFSISVNDTDNNFIHHQLTVTVSDMPQWGIIPDDLSYFEGSTGNTINWTATDMFPNSYIIYQDGIEVDSGGWTNSINITLIIDGLQKGVYNFTIVLYDTLNNAINDMVNVTVIDNIDPTITGPLDFGYSEGTTSNEISWLGTDMHSDTYQIWNATHQISSGSWTSGVAIIYDIDGLLKGIYNFTIIVFDNSGNSNFDTVIINVTDDTFPVFLYPTTDLQFNEETVAGKTINWAASDSYNDTYIIYQNGSNVQNGNWNVGENITMSLDGLLKGWYEYRIVISDNSSNSIQNIVWVTILDENDPGFTLIPSDLPFNEGDTGQILTWRGSDLYNNTYEIFKDGSLADNGTWSTGIDISFDLDPLSLTKGTYTFTITIYDESGNFASDTVLVTVSDGTDPLLIYWPSDYQYSEGTTGHQVEWIVSDNYEATYVINDDAGLVKSGNWASGINITLDINGLLKGVYNYTITVYDDSGNSVVDLFSVTVIDTTFPVMIEFPSNIQYAEGDTGKTLTWDAVDSYNATFEIWNETDAISIGIWNSSVPIIYDINGLDKGTYNFTMIFIDQSNNRINHTILFDVTDETLPVVDSPNDINYLEGEINKVITWTVSDKYADYYEIFNGSDLFTNGTWTSGTISIFVNGSSIGVYLYTLYLFDLSGNTVNDTVLVQVIETTPPVIPIFPSDSQFNETEINGIYLIWTATDAYPGTYTIYLEGQVEAVQSGDWNNSMQIILSLDGYLKGTHNFTIFIEDSSFNQVNNTVIVTIVDELAPSIIDTGAPVDNIYNSGTTGNSLNWTVIDLHPNTYSISSNTSGELVSNSFWQSNNPISISIDGLSIGFHNYTIIITDDSGNSNSSTIILHVIDLDSPIVDTLLTDASFNEGGSTTLIYSFLDENPNNFMVYKNGSFFDSGSWSSNQLFFVPVSNLEKGFYNFTIVVFDDAGNSETGITILQVSDKTDPSFIIIPISNQLNYTEGTIGHILTWSMTDNFDRSLHEGVWQIYQNGTLLNWQDYTDEDNNLWFISVAEQIILDGFESGTYNITFVIFDTSNNSASSSILLTVFDKQDPVINSIPTINHYNESTTNHVLTWNVFDLHAGYYNITINGETYLAFESWDKNADININIDGLDTNIYNFTITFYDLSFNFITDSVVIEVFDITSPVFVITQEIKKFLLDEIGTTLIWEGFDLHPGTFVVTQDGFVINSGTWNNLESIVTNIDGKTRGFYNFTIELIDESGNSIIHSIIIRIKDPNIIDTVKPEIILENSVYEGDVDVFDNIWTNMTGDPISDATIIVKLIQNEEVIQQFGTFTHINGEYSILFNYTNLPAGDYYWVISFEKTGYQDWQDLIFEVKVLPHTYSLEFDVHPTLTQGEEYFISAKVSYANNVTNSNQLLLSELISLSGAAEGVIVQFTIIVEIEAGNKTIIKNVITDDKGVALFKLSKAETTAIIRVLSIRADIMEGDTKSSTPFSLEFNPSGLPVVVPGKPDLFTLILDFIEDNAIVVPIVLILIITSISLSIIYSRRSQDRAKQLNRDVKSAFVELKAIKSIQSIIIQNEAKVTIYEEQVSETEMNTNLIGGMVTAFSSFLNELGKSDQSGFEMMEREGISITAHKGRSSIFIVISSEKLPFVMLNQIQRAQRAIESSFRSNFSRKGEVKTLTKKQVHPKFDLSSFKVALKYQLSFNGRNIRNLLKEKSLSRALKQNIDYLAELPDTEFMRDSKISLENIVEFYRTKGITERVSSRTIILAYQYNIFEAIVEERL